MRISDWSSDVCSSDLAEMAAIAGIHVLHIKQYGEIGCVEVRIPGWFATNGGAQLQIAFDKRRDAGRQDAVQAFYRIAMARHNMMQPWLLGHGFAGHAPYQIGRAS